MEPEEDREFLDLLENEESDTQKPMTIHHSLETEPTHLEWGIKITIFFVLLTVLILTVFTYKILNPPELSDPADTSSP
jgi:hypothetical protein